MSNSSRRFRFSPRTLCVAALGPVLATLTFPFAAAQARAPATVASAHTLILKLFPGSRLITRPSMSVEVIGSGPDVVLIPGLASSKETWRHTA